VVRPRARDRWTILLVFAAVTVAAGFGLRAWQNRPLGIVLDGTTMRMSPHGLAPPVGPVEAGGAVRILRRQAGWTLVRAPGARQGWLAAGTVAAIGG
jgi:hypothetical protein